MWTAKVRVLGVALVALLWGTLPVAALQCETREFEGTDYSLCVIDLAQDDLRLFLNGRDDQPLGHFADVNVHLGNDGTQLGFAMNAGMYHDDRSPVGHYVEDGQEQMRVIPNAGTGKFGMVPNGVFCIADGQARVIETKTFLKDRPTCRYATQSGPMLVIDGALHPRFLPDSTSRYVRNGVGTSDDGTLAVFVISDAPVNFHSFARFFRDVLSLNQALFLDGNVSRLYAPSLGRADRGWPLGPIVGVVEPKTDG